MKKIAKKSKRDKPADIVFVLDATTSTQCVFTAMIEHVSSIIFDITTKFRRALIYCGAVIYRDPVDYRPPPETAPLDPEVRMQMEQIEAQTRAERKRRLKERGINIEDEERAREERRKLFDNVKYPEDINVAIDLVPDTEKLISELEKVECKAGNDEPEDWVGALDIALNDISWRNESKKIIVWIADANAHGRKYCGTNNHQEEKSKLEPLIKQMAQSNIYFIGINVRKGDDGCRRTLEEIKKIYLRNRGKNFNIQDVEYSVDPDAEPDEIPLDFMDDFEKTLAQTIRREFPTEIFG